MYPVSSKGLNKETKTAIYFFTVPFEPLNNFSAHQVEIWSMCFPTAEHAYQWKKFSETQVEIAKQILEAGSPETAQYIAREHTKLLPKEWHDKKVAVMEKILRAKLAQHESVRDALKRSGERKIVENSPVDNFWGCGPKGDGKNMMGVLWMKIRDSI